MISAFLFSYPILCLVVRGWVSGLFFLIAGLSVLSLLRSKALLDRSTWDAKTMLFVIAMASSTFAVMLSQAYHQEFRATPYDESLRLLLAVPIYLVIRGGEFKIMVLLRYAFPLGAITAFVASGLEPYRPYADSGRLGTYFLNVIHFGDLALMLGMLSLFSINLEQRNSPGSLLINLSGLFAGVYLSLESGSRGGWIAAPMLAAYWLLSGNKGKVRAKTVAILAIAVAAVLVSVFADTIHERIADVFSGLSAFHRGNGDTSIGLRLEIWQVAVHLFLANPLFGMGTEGYREAILMLEHSGAIGPLVREFAIAEVHNQILSYAVKYGTFGLLSILAVYFVPLVLFVQAAGSSAGQARIAGGMGVCLVGGFFIFGLSVEIFNLKNTVTFYSLTLASLLALAAPPRNADRVTAAPGKQQ